MSTALAQRLRAAADGHQEGAHNPGALRLTFSDLLAAHGESSAAVMLMLLAVVSVLPLAGTGTVMSLGIWAVAWAWLRGANLRLPQRLGSVTLNERWSGRCLRGLAWIYEQGNRWLRPRWAPWSHPNTGAAWALWIALMGFVIFLPLPMGNVLPSLSLILLSLGWMFRDGVALLLSTLTGLAALVYLGSVWHLLALMVQKLYAA